MMVACVRAGFEEERLLDMDIISFTAMHEELTRQELLDAASEVTRTAVASQGDSKGIRGLIKDLRKAAGEENTGGKGLDDFIADHG